MLNCSSETIILKFGSRKQLKVWGGVDFSEKNPKRIIVMFNFAKTGFDFDAYVG